MLYIEQLIWDDWNRQHIARHNVSPQEVEEVCKADPVTSQSYGGRFLAIGMTTRSRILSVVLHPEGKGIYYPVTARPASRKERTYYQQEIERSVA